MNNLKEKFFLCRNFAMTKGSNQRFLPQNGKKSPEFQRSMWPQLLENLKVFTYDVLFALHHTVALNCYRLFGEFRKQRQQISTYRLIHINCPYYSPNGGSFSRIHQHTAHKRGSISRIHQPKGGPPLNFNNQKEIPSTKKGQFLWIQRYTVLFLKVQNSKTFMTSNKHAPQTL